MITQRKWRWIGHILKHANGSEGPRGVWHNLKRKKEKTTNLKRLDEDRIVVW